MELCHAWRSTADGGIPVITLGHPLLDDYLAFVAARGRTNTWLAVASDLKIFFTVVARPPAEVTAADVFGFLAAQRAPRHGSRVVRLEDGEAGLAARTITWTTPGLLEAPQPGEDGAMSNPRYTAEMRERAVKMVMQVRRESGQEKGAVARVAQQLGIGREALRGWVAQAEVDSGARPGTTSDDKQRIRNWNGRIPSSAGRMRS